MMMSGGEAARPGRPGPAGARGVLLYYFYPSSTGTTGGGGAERGARVGGEVRFTAAEREELARFYEATLREAGGVVGRVRVALDGLNATLGGPVDALKLHVRDVRAHPLLSALGAAGIDFKLQRYPESDGEEDPARAAQVRAETGFDRLSVRRVLEVISMGSQERPRAGGEDADAGCSGRGGDALAARAPLHGAGVHLDPSEWHAALAGAARGDEEVLLLDARNWYERRIGGFAAARVGCLDAKVSMGFGHAPAAAGVSAAAGRTAQLRARNGPRASERGGTHRFPWEGSLHVPVRGHEGGRRVSTWAALPTPERRGGKRLCGLTRLRLARGTDPGEARRRSDAHGRTFGRRSRPLPSTPIAAGC